MCVCVYLRKTNLINDESFSIETAAAVTALTRE
jgi:hypothetical protein